MLKLIGYERNDFTVKNSGEVITGYNIYMSRSITQERGKGQAVERFYMTDAKLNSNGFDLGGALGKDVNVYYNRWGKVERICLA